MSLTRNTIIPASIHQLWMGEQPPAWVTACMESVRRQHPSWEYVLWGEQELTDLLPGSLMDLWVDAHDLTLPGRIYQFRADLARYAILHRYGGVWIDTDFEFHHPLDNTDRVLDEPWLAYEQQDVWISNAIIAAEAGNEFLGALVGRLPEHCRYMRRTNGLVSASRLSGPRFLTRMFSQLDPDISVRPQAEFFPYAWSDLDAARRGTIATHHFANQRTLRDKPLEIV